MDIKIQDHPLFVFWLILFMLLVILTIVSSILFLNARERDKVEKTKEISNMVATYSNDTFNSINNMLSETIDKLNANDFKSNISQERYNELITILKTSQSRYRGIVVIALTDDLGNMFVDTVRDHPKRDIIVVTDRKYYEYLSSHLTEKPYISGASISKTTGKWVIHMVRRLNNPNGSFAGLIIASISIEDTFSEMFQHVNIGKNTLITLRDRNHYYIARMPFNPEGFGKPIPPTAISRMFLEQGLTSGSVKFTSPVDGETRYGSFMKLKDYDIYAIVAFTM